MDWWICHTIGRWQISDFDLGKQSSTHIFTMGTSLLVAAFVPAHCAQHTYSNSFWNFTHGFFSRVQNFHFNGNQISHLNLNTENYSIFFGFGVLFFSTFIYVYLLIILIFLLFFDLIVSWWLLRAGNINRFIWIWIRSIGYGIRVSVCIFNSSNWCVKISNNNDFTQQICCLFYHFTFYLIQLDLVLFFSFVLFFFDWVFHVIIRNVSLCVNAGNESASSFFAFATEISIYFFYSSFRYLKFAILRSVLYWRYTEKGRYTELFSHVNDIC